MLDTFGPFFILGYAEIHHRFKFAFSLLRRKTPEIYFDAPRRIGPGRPIPALLLVKDADRYPVEITRITAAMAFMDTKRIFMREWTLPAGEIKERLFHQVYHIPLPEGFSGQVNLNFKLEGRLNGKPFMVLNDNLPFGSHFYFPVTVAAAPLPSREGWLFGEPHFHSSYTTDEVEFGAPLEAVVDLARAMGLSFAFAADHSYDLDPRNPFSTVKGAFSTMRGEASARSTKDFVIVPGEEASLRNSCGKNVHLGLINHPEFIEGYADSGRGSTRRCAYDIKTVAETCGSSLCFAAHPGYRPGFLESLLLNRGYWSNDDYREGVAATQFWNGPMDRAFFRGRRQWIDLLLAGRRMAVLGGNDAHGDFNRVRKVGFPFLTIKEDNRSGFGRVRTGVLTGDLSASGIIKAVKECRTMATNGPFAELSVDKSHFIGDTFIGGKAQLTVSALSTVEFGPVTDIKLYKGIINGKEQVVLEWKPGPEAVFTLETAYEADIHAPCYFRVEVSSKLANDVFFCMTSPIWARPE